MSEMGEKIAIAMREAYAKDSGVGPMVSFEHSGARESWLVCARTAIEAMRKPSQQMEEAGDLCPHGSSADFVWRNMISAALEPSPETSTITTDTIKNSIAGDK